jgi:flagellar hook assembly protein FlgD
VVIAVIDSGVDSNHPDLVDQLLAGTNTTNQGSGANDTDDIQGHGTHVAGIAAGATNNGVGTAGVCPECKILPIRAMFNDGTGDSFDVIEGINWVTQWADNNPTKKVIINMSLGFTAKVSALETAINNAYNKGIILFASSGNDGKAVLRYPAAYPNVIGIGSTTSANVKSSFSNMGTYVDVTAPGTAILATTNDGAYGYKQGTSMATPNAAGVAGLIWSKRTDLTNYQLEWLLKASSKKASGQTKRDNNFGHGIVDAYAAITASGDKFNSSIAGSTVSLPTLSTATTLSFTSAGEGHITAKVYDSEDTLIRTIVEEKAIKAGVQKIAWDAKNNSKAFVASGTYTLVAGVKYENGNSAMESKQLTVDRSVGVSNAQVSNAILDLTNGGPVSTSLTFSTSEAIAGVVAVLDSNNKVVKTFSPAFSLINGATSATYTWDGKNSAKVPAYVGDGVYKFAVVATDALKNKETISVNVTVKGRAPTLALAATPNPYNNKAFKSNMKINYTLSEPVAELAITIKNSGGTTVATFNYPTGKNGGLNTQLWNAWVHIGGGYYQELFGGTYTAFFDGADADGNEITGSVSFAVQ